MDTNERVEKAMKELEEALAARWAAGSINAPKYEADLKERLTRAIEGPFYPRISPTP